MRTRTAGRAAVLCLLMFAFAWAAAGLPAPPGPKDRCAVCGMFVARTPQWVATLTFRGGGAAFFDGPKDLFRFYLGGAHDAKGKTAADVEELWVTEYYSAKPLRAREALYALGSDVVGPMGPELVPLRDRAQADAFRKDHKATAVVSFGEVTAALLSKLE